MSIPTISFLNWQGMMVFSDMNLFVHSHHVSPRINEKVESQKLILAFSENIIYYRQVFYYIIFTMALEGSPWFNKHTSIGEHL